MSDPLTQKFEAILIQELDNLNVQSLVGKAGDQGPAWPPKERIALLEVVSEYLASKRKLDSSGGMGGALGGGRE